MNHTTIKMKFNFLLIFSLLLTGCFIAPGMHMKSNGKTIYIDSLDKNLNITPINEFSDEIEVKFSYKIGIGDQISVTIWGLPELFPIINITPDQNLRRVDQNGNIFFPYAGLVQALGRTQDELRNDITIALTEYFNDPQVDVTISRFNSQQIFVLGEVTRPSKINITDVPVSLSDAIGQSLGLNTNTAGKDVFIIRQEDINGTPKIYYANLESPSYFIDAGKFFLMNNDIVYVNSSSTTRWNKVVSQFFPFSAFINSVDTFINR